MLGNNVTVKLTAPDQEVSGELRKQTAEGIWIYGGWAEKAAVTFYPAHRVLEIRDAGRTYR